MTGTFNQGSSNPSDMRRLVSVWNNTLTDYPRHCCIHTIFEQQAEMTPASIALRFANQAVSYRELNQQANRIAHKLRKLGVGPESMVGILVDRSVAMVAGILGILKAGGVYVPFDASYPAERLAFMASDTTAKVLLVQQAVADRLRGFDLSGIATLSLDREMQQFSDEDTTNPTNLTTPESLAYVMYTSGSTGVPKGAMVPHRAVVRLVKNTNYVRLGERQTFLQFAPISFDASTLEIWGPLLNGGCLAIMPPGAASLDQLGAAIRQYEVNTLWLTAGLFNLMVDQRLDDLAPLQQLLVGGDALSPAHVKKAIAGLPGCTLINGYGPTEGTTFSCCHTISLEDAGRAAIPIGKPIANTQVVILNPQNQLAEIGENGELCIAGDGLARGYLNQPELTAAKFVKNPLADAPDSLIYRTGDLARFRADGVIEFAGRIDNQVKINGFRIEPGEIEAALMRYAEVREAVVLTPPDAAGEKRLVAYVVAGEHGCATSNLREFLQSRLPAYMVPSTFVLMQELPLSPNGKIDREALAAAEQSTAQSECRVRPVGHIEEKIAAVWQKVLGAKEIGREDNFFDCGGDSLQLLEAHSEIQKVTGSEIAITELFEHTTVSALAQHLAGSEAQPAASSAASRAQQQQSAYARQRAARAGRGS